MIHQVEIIQEQEVEQPAAYLVQAQKKEYEVAGARWIVDKKHNIVTFLEKNL